MLKVELMFTAKIRFRIIDQTFQGDYSGLGSWLGLLIRQVELVEASVCDRQCFAGTVVLHHNGKVSDAFWRE